MWPQVWPSVTSWRTEWRLRFTLAVALAHRAHVFPQLSPLPSPPQASLRCTPQVGYSGCRGRLLCPALHPPPAPAMDPWAPAPHALHPVPRQTSGLGSASCPCRHPDPGHPHGLLSGAAQSPPWPPCLGSSGADEPLTDPQLSTTGSPRAPIFQLSQRCQPLLSPDSGLGSRSYIPVMSAWQASRQSAQALRGPLALDPGVSGTPARPATQPRQAHRMQHTGHLRPHAGPMRPNQALGAQLCGRAHGPGATRNRHSQGPLKAAS